jgi:hypothetical protein
MRQDVDQAAAPVLCLGLARACPRKLKQRPSSGHSSHTCVCRPHADAAFTTLLGQLSKQYNVTQAQLLKNKKLVTGVGGASCKLCLPAAAGL